MEASTVILIGYCLCFRRRRIFVSRSAVPLEHDSSLAVIKRYDSPETLFYCDPPYPLASRGGTAYGYEMSDDQHRDLARVLRNVQGKVALSGYHCDLMNELYGDWQYIEAPEKYCHSVKTLRREVLWVNYEGDVHEERVKPDGLLAETVRQLRIFRDERA